MVEHLAYVLRNLRYMREQDRLQEIALGLGPAAQPLALDIADPQAVTEACDRIRAEQGEIDHTTAKLIRTRTKFTTSE